MIEQAGINQTAAGNTPGAENPAIYFNARFVVANEDRALKPLMTAMIVFVLEEAKDAVLVPSAALQRTAPGRARLRILLNDGHPQERSIRIGLSNGSDVQVIDGVEPGEAVIVADTADGEQFVAARSRTR
jgi:macrolide-specific efflux system membrane fusion protein